MPIDIETIICPPKINFFAKILHYYRYQITKIALRFRKTKGIDDFAPKSFWFKLMDLTLFKNHSDAFYMKYPYICFCLTDKKLINKLFKHHRCDENSIFKGNNGMFRFVNIIKEMYPDNIFESNDCMLTCDANNTKKYHNILKKKLGQCDANKFIIRDNIDKYFGNLHGKNDINNLIDKYILDNLLGVMFNKSYTNDYDIFFDSSSKINNYLYTVGTIKNQSPDNDEYIEARNNFKKIIDKIVNENSDFFDQENFSLAQRRLMVSILLFPSQETTRTLICYTIFLLSKYQPPINETIDVTVDKIFNQSLMESTPSPQIVRIMRNNTVITNGVKSYYPADTAIGAMSCNLTKMYPNESMTNYNTYFPFGTGKHRCPGEKIVLYQTKMLIEYLLLNYKITTDNNEIKIVRLFVQKIENNYLTTFHPLNLK